MSGTMDKWKGKLLIGGIYKSQNNDVKNHDNLFTLLLLGTFNHPGIHWQNWITDQNENHISFRFIELLRDNFMY